jgi:hypothetical protein
MRAIRVVDRFEEGKDNLDDFIGALSVNCWELGRFNCHPRNIFTQTIVDELKKRNFHCEFDKPVFVITEKDLKQFAEERFNMTLEEDELRDAIKGVESGLGHCWDDILYYAIQEAFEESGRIRP